VLALRYVPAHVDEASDPVDNLGGILSIVMVAGVVLAINFATIPGAGTAAIGIALVGIAAAAGFVIRQRRASNPLYDLKVATRRTFWVAALAGIIVFGTLMAAMFIGQQYLQNVLGWSTWEAGLAILPAALMLVLVAPFSAKLVDSRGARFTLLAGYTSCFLGFVVMLLFWTDSASFWPIGIAYALVGVGVGLAGTPASHSLTGSVPVRRAGMASATADLQRDLGGAIMQSILGALLTAGYATSFSRLIASSPDAEKVSSSVEAQLVRSFSSAANTAERYPQYSDQIIEAARQSFIKGEDLAYLGGIFAILLGAALVWKFFPKFDEETRLLMVYAAEDSGDATAG
jgi:MFS transporter, DHA2 family, multidrug resistance protein